MELRHLRYFIAVAEELHFGRAALRLHIAQPPLSQQIRALEGELGVILLERTKRSVRLTEAGRAFYEAARETLASAERAIQAAQRAARGEVGDLAIGFVGSAMFGVLPEVLRAYRARYPDVRLTLREHTTSEQSALLRAGRLDIGFVRPPVAGDSLALKTVVRERLVVALPDTHPLAYDREAALSVSRLAGEPFIFFPRHLGPGFYDAIISFCQRAGFTPSIRQEAVQMQTIVSLVAAGMGVALVPRSVQNLARSGVVYRSLEERTPGVEVAALWRERDRSPVLSAFLDVVGEAAENGEAPIAFASGGTARQGG